MSSERTLHIIKHLRKNSRISLKELGRRTQIPVSTLFDKLKEFPFIKSYTCLLNYKQLGYDLRLILLLKAQQEHKQALELFLKEQSSLNALAEVNNGYDYMAELFFRNIREYHKFLKLMQVYTKAYQEIFILNELEEEAFLSKKKNIVQEAPQILLPRKSKSLNR